MTLSINHHHDFGRRFQDASFRLEGDRGAAIVKLGLLLDYPRGEPDEFGSPHAADLEPVQLEGVVPGRLHRHNVELAALRRRARTRF